jgi:hypothetical protein
MAQLVARIDYVRVSKQIAPLYRLGVCGLL